jgi:hypothetical protein
MGLNLNYTPNRLVDITTLLGWIPATPVGSRSALRPTALAVSEGTIRTASGLI